MPIEFRCTQCQRLLRTPDDTAGRQAKCPECGALMTIPAPAAAGPTGLPPAPPPTWGDSEFARSAGAGAENPYQSPEAYAPPAGYVPPPGTFAPTVVEMGDVFRRTWAIFKDQLLMCIAGPIIVIVVNAILGQVLSQAAALTGAAMRDETMAGFLAVLGVIATWLFALWLSLGQKIYLVKLARGDKPDIADLFRGGPYYLTALLASILVGLDRNLANCWQC